MYFIWVHWFWNSAFVNYVQRLTWSVKGHVDLVLQLHGLVFESLFFINFLLCQLIMLEIFSVQKQLTLTAILLKILWSLLDFGKAWSNKFRKRFVTLVMTFWLYSMVNEMMFQLLLCFGLFSVVCVLFSLMEWYPLFSKAFSCSTFVELKISILDKFLWILRDFDVDDCLILMLMMGRMTGGGNINVQ